MCQNVRHYGCGHMKKRRTVCYKTGSRRAAAPPHPIGLVQAVLDFLFPPADAACDDMTGEVRPVRGPCPACAREQVLMPGRGKPLPQLPGPARLYREASQAKTTVGGHDLKLNKERQGTRAKELDLASPAAVTGRPWHQPKPDPFPRRVPLQPGVRDRLTKPRPTGSSSGSSTLSDRSHG